MSVVNFNIESYSLRLFCIWCCPFSQTFQLCRPSVLNSHLQELFFVSWWSSTLGNVVEWGQKGCYWFSTFLMLWSNVLTFQLIFSYIVLRSHTIYVDIDPASTFRIAWTGGKRLDVMAWTHRSPPKFRCFCANVLTSFMSWVFNWSFKKAKILEFNIKYFYHGYPTCASTLQVQAYTQVFCNALPIYWKGFVAVLHWEVTHNAKEKACPHPEILPF